MNLHTLLAIAPLAVLHAQTGVVPAAVAAVQQEKPPSFCVYRSSEDFVPMTRSERLTAAQASLAGPSPFLFTAVRTAIDQAANRPREWRQGAGGFGWRSGSIYAELVIDQTFEQSVAYFRREDNRYFISGERNPARRLGYAIASAFLARHEDGTRGLSVSAIGGAATAAFISRAWQPRSTTTAADAAVSMGLTLGVRAGLNILREFSPRFSARILQ